MDKLLERLRENGRATPEELAETLDRDVEEVKEQIREYEEQGVIKGYRTVINREALPESEVPVTALVELTISPEPDAGFESVAHDISKHPSVKSCYLCSGDYDLLVRVESDDLRAVSEFVANELAPNRSIHGTVSHFLLKTYKEDDVIFDETVPDNRLSISF
jgi:DNA-binding Lrp family transcriptional regulator